VDTSENATQWMFILHMREIKDGDDSQIILLKAGPTAEAAHRIGMERDTREKNAIIWVNEREQEPLHGEGWGG
jgi:hypothetical protein